MTSTVVMHGSFKGLLELAKNGDVIELYQGPYNRWCADPEGIDIMLINRSGVKNCLVNGRRWVAGVWDSYCPTQIEERKRGLYSVTGFVIKFVCKGHYNNHCAHPKGAMRITENGILVNEKEIIYPWKVDEVKFHPNGALARLGNRFFLVVFKKQISLKAKRKG